MTRDPRTDPRNDPPRNPFAGIELEIVTPNCGFWYMLQEKGRPPWILPLATHLNKSSAEYILWALRNVPSEAGSPGPVTPRS